MQIKQIIFGSLATFALATTHNLKAIEVNADKSLFKENKSTYINKKTSELHIVQMKEKPGVSQAQDIGELLPSNQVVGIAGNNYNANTPALISYTKAIEERQYELAKQIGSITIIHSFKHTFNGFSAKLTKKQIALLESHPDVAGVWKEKLQKVTTSNTPEFLGLTSSTGQHTLNIKGENVVIGVLDTGISPEHPSFADDGTYSDPLSIGWNGICDTGEEAEENTFQCNNKLIGARYFNETFKSVYDIQTSLGEFISPRDADGHGSHTASTAGGNANVEAVLAGREAGFISGIAPRARVAMYKVCWNSNYISPTGADEAGCFPSDSMAAIDQAVVDGVDIINFSIGGSLTDLTQPAAAAMLRATQAGVFVSVSAGNEGPDAETVGTPAPWVTSVAASTYDGISKVIGKALMVNSGELTGSSIIAVPADFAPEANDLSGDIVVSNSIEACDADDGSNPILDQTSLAGNVALIARGSCDFTQKFINAQEAGAIAAIIYTYEASSPFAMGGSDSAIAIPGSMISFDDGQALITSAMLETTNITLTNIDADEDTLEVGNIMASFSSRGPNQASYDIIKPDITAPGVKILAATSNTPMFGQNGNTFAYLQGTSMSSPHIAGLAALFKDSHPQWTPAQIKSSLMTTARQDLVKEDGVTPADPFDFGAGHASPVNALDSGLVYSANYNDYLAFLCGIGNETYVANLGTSCETLVESGFSTEPSQLNIASIAIAELSGTESITRTVTNVTDTDSIYSATIIAPQGVNVTITTFDDNGNATEDGLLRVKAGNSASYVLTFSALETAEFDEWAFGAITLSDNNGHNVRSPIAIKVVPIISIEVPEVISGELNRGRLTFPVKMLYSGATSIEFAGFVAPFGSTNIVEQDPDQSFSFNEAGLAAHLFHIPEGTQVARFSLNDTLVGNGSGAIDLDIYVYRCDEWLCSPVGQSYNFASNEDVILVNPEPRANVDNGDVYIVWVHGYDLAGDESIEYTMPVWIADRKESTSRVISSRRAIENRFNNVTIMTKNLTEGTFMGGITFYDDKGIAQGTTIVEINN